MSFMKIPAITYKIIGPKRCKNFVLGVTVNFEGGFRLTPRSLRFADLAAEDFILLGV